MTIESFEYNFSETDTQVSVKYIENGTENTVLVDIVFVEGIFPVPNTCTLNVLVETFDTVNHLALAQSVDLGYVWLVALLSSAHVNVIESSANLT